MEKLLFLSNFSYKALSEKLQKENRELKIEVEMLKKVAETAKDISQVQNNGKNIKLEIILKLNQRIEELSKENLNLKLALDEKNAENYALNQKLTQLAENEITIKEKTESDESASKNKLMDYEMIIENLNYKISQLQFELEMKNKMDNDKINLINEKNEDISRRSQPFDIKNIELKSPQIVIINRRIIKDLFIKDQIVIS